jgi:molecular chaperone DnaJ
MAIRVPKVGDAPMAGKGAPGDLLVRVSIAGSKAFRRQGPNLYHEARIPLHTALLGGRVRVPTVDGSVDVRIPGGTQQGEEMVLRGQGMPVVYRKEKGDLFVTFNVLLPRCVKCHLAPGEDLICVPLQIPHLAAARIPPALRRRRGRPKYG